MTDFLSYLPLATGAVIVERLALSLATPLLSVMLSFTI